MNIACRVGKHVPSPQTHSNQGFTFSRCARCDRDLMRSNAKWIVVPRQLRVVWRGMEDLVARVDASPAQFLTPTAAVPAEPSPSCGTMGSAPMPARALRRSSPFSMMDLLGLGAAVLVWLVSDRLRQFRFAVHQPLLLLPAPTQGGQA